MSKVLCVTGHRFSPEQEAFLWAHTQARGYATGVWVPDGLVRRMGIRCNGAASPVEVSAENGVHLFYNLSQLCISQEDVEKYLQASKSEEEEEEKKKKKRMVKMQIEENAKKKIIHSLDGVDGNDHTPLNTNGEPFSDSIAQSMRKICGHGSQYWASESEASYIFGSPFHSSFLQPENAIVFPGDALCRRLVYYNVCGTERPYVFNAETCCRYRPTNVYGKAYSPAIATVMKRSAIRHNCVGSTVWITTHRLARAGLAVARGVEPLSMMVGGNIIQLVNIAMTKNPRAAEDFAMRLLHAERQDKVDSAECSVSHKPMCSSIV